MRERERAHTSHPPPAYIRTTTTGDSAPGTIVSEYVQGDTIDVDFDISANHAGGMQVRLCDLSTSGSGCTAYQDFGAPLENAEAGGDPYARYTFHVTRKFRAKRKTKP